MKPREVLNKLKWSEGNLHRAKIVILHRGGPNNEKVILGSDIVSIPRGRMIVRTEEGELEIPYHRILRIELDGEIIWKRR